MRSTLFHRLAVAGVLLTLVVVVLGAWVRLTDAGLGCPDWPGCYGAMIVPDTPEAIDEADQAFPDRPLESGRAWREMIHRYAAGALGLLVLALAVIAVCNRNREEQAVTLPLILLGLIVFQALLGMWTVTLLLKPVIVVLHLLGGMTTLALLAWLVLGPTHRTRHRLTGFATIALAVLAAQIALGGWTSANYAALACPDFPTCQNEIWPEMDFSRGFALMRDLGLTDEDTTLVNAARSAIHVGHRIGALITTLLLAALAILALRQNDHTRLRRSAAAVVFLLVTQVALGIAIVKLSLPLSLATAHNGVAALLVLALIGVNHAVRSQA